jgi:O-antigen/teichoic acid export membrane protein
MALLASAKFAGGGAVAGWIMAGLAIQSVLSVAAIGLLLARRSLLVMTLVIAAGALSVAANVLLVPLLGIRGSGLAVFAVMLALGAAQMLLARRWAPVIMPWRALATYGGVALMGAALATQVHVGSPWLDLVARGGVLVLIYALALFLLDRPLLTRLMRWRTAGAV